MGFDSLRFPFDKPERVLAARYIDDPLFMVTNVKVNGGTRYTTWISAPDTGLALFVTSFAIPAGKSFPYGEDVEPDV